MSTSSVETIYQSQIAEMTGAEKIARSAAMFEWTRGMVARQIESTTGPLSAERMKWEVALRIYGDDPTTRSMIERILLNVSG